MSRSRTPRLTAEQAALAGRYYGFGLKIASSWAASFPGQHDEFVSAAGLGLVRAAARFNPDWAIADFSGFARPFIRGAIINVIARERRNPLTDRREKFAVVRDPEIDNCDLIDWLARGLSARREQIMRLISLRYQRGIDVAALLCLSQDRISVEHRKAIAHMTYRARGA